jgi:predicted alpha/beta superfamily hydrolase
MKKETFQIGSTNCIVFFDEMPQILLIQPIDSHDFDILEDEIAYILSHSNFPFILVAFSISNWNNDLSPWIAPPVFGKVGFGEGAKDTLSFILEKLLPSIRDTYNLTNIPTVLGGYSLAGLFALWSAYKTDDFLAINASSPSAWFPGFIDYVENNTTTVRHIYLSLGDKEEKAQNPIMATVGTCIKKLFEIFNSRNINSTLEWNDGNHFKNADIRTAKGFVWCMAMSLDIK